MIDFLKYLAVMAGVTYLIRVLPFVLIRHKIQNKFVSAFLDYIPYAVLASMTVPAILYSTSSVITAVAGFVVAIVLAYREKSLIVVALCASAAVLVGQICVSALT
ncbi:MAG: AzlD domain-containing protein [Lachnospiraceae bacterium]|nr:AzlD domain-containing protein [Lachnospiraceae bacterium]